MMKEMMSAAPMMPAQKPPEISPRTGKPKRRKATRACVHCQRTHLTCDNSRPCERCVDRGLAATCCDGTRKRAKYLGEEVKQEPVPAPPLAQPMPQPVPVGRPRGQPLSQPVGRPVGQPTSHELGHGLANGLGALGAVLVPSHVPVPPYVQTHSQPHGQDQYMMQFDSTFESTTADEYNALGTILHIDANEVSPLGDVEFNQGNDLTLENFDLDHLLDDSPLSDWLAPKPPPIALTITQPHLPPDLSQPSHVYRMVTQPFPYTPGFHALFGYLKRRFQRPQLMQIVQSMAKYRPSFIAYASNLTREDLVFLEQGFQRSLLEYQKYFAFSGTPTIIWRRTGQIAAVGPEFCMLTGYDQHDLIPADGGSKFIVELFDDASTLAYFQTFSEIAFGDHHGVRMAACTLTTKAGKAVRTSSVLTLKRDMFGIPMLIIGNFLPILV